MHKRKEKQEKKGLERKKGLVVVLGMFVCEFVVGVISGLDWD